MSNTPTLETERLILRKFTENDLEALYQIYRDPDVNRFLSWFPLQSMDEARKFFEDRYASLYAEPQAYAYAICLKRGNRPIGYVKVDMAEPHDFGYGLRAEFWHQGIATEAGRAVTAQVKRDGLPYITATHDVNNPRSGGVMHHSRHSKHSSFPAENIKTTVKIHLALFVSFLGAKIGVNIPF